MTSDYFHLKHQTAISSISLFLSLHDILTHCCMLQPILGGQVCLFVSLSSIVSDTDTNNVSLGDLGGRLVVSPTSRNHEMSFEMSSQQLESRFYLNIKAPAGLIFK